MSVEHLAPRLRVWYPASQESSERWGVNVCLILGVLDREGACGELLRPKGPAGTGDWVARPWSRYAQKQWATSRLRHWMPSQEEFDAWCRIRKKKQRSTDDKTPFELCLPIDGLGFGRGLSQLDWCDEDNFAFLAVPLPDGTFAWQDGPRNIDEGTRKLHNLIELFDHEEGLAAAAYNAGPARVREVRASLAGATSPEQLLKAVDAVTTDHNYASDVLGRRDRFARLLSSGGAE